jgi:hypothetical protein
MSEIKISELPLATSVKDADFIPIVSEGETKRATKRTLAMSKGGIDVFDYILSLGPKHYWPLTLPDFGLDAITRISSTRVDVGLNALSGPIVRGADRVLENVTTTTTLNTDQILDYSNGFSVSYIMRVGAANAKTLGSLTNDNKGFLINIGGTSNLGFTVGTGTTFVTLSASNNTATAGSILHIVAIHDPENGRYIYRNGVLVATGTAVLDHVVSDVNFLIYDFPFTAAQQTFRGHLQDVAFFDRVLSEEEITEIYELSFGV